MVTVAGLPLACTPVHSLNLPRCSYSVPLEAEAQRRETRLLKVTQVAETVLEPNRRFPNFPF